MSESLYGESGTQAAKTAPQGLMEQMVGIFTEPAKVFQRLKDTPNWTGVFLLVLLLTLAVSMLWAHKVDAVAQAEHNLQVVESLMGRPIPQAQIDKTLEQVQGQPYLKTFLGILIIHPLALLIQTLLVWGFSFMGRNPEDGPSTFKHAWAAVNVQTLVMVPALLLATAMVATRSVGGQSLLPLTPTHLAFFTHPEAPLVRGLHTLLDPFYFWSFALLAYGMKHTLRARTGAIVALLLLFALFGLSFRFMGGMF